jgi:hypothetical protein
VQELLQPCATRAVVTWFKGGRRGFGHAAGSINNRRLRIRPAAGAAGVLPGHGQFHFSN